jgi:hypothetical protein
LTGIALAGGTALLPIAAESLANTTTEDRSEWVARLRAYETAKAERIAHDPVWDAAYARYKPARPNMDAVIDWKQLGISYRAHRDHTARVMDVEHEWQKYLAGEGKWWWGGKDPEACKARQRAGLDTILRFRRLEAEAYANSGAEAADEKSGALSETESDTWATLLRTPAPDGAALLYKLDLLFADDDRRENDEHCDAWNYNLIDPVMADARRLLAQGRA